MSMKSWLKHAFAVQTHSEPLTSAERQVVQRICLEVVRRQMTTPAITFLEMARPLNYLGSQTLQFFMPIVSALTEANDVQTFVNFLERRDAIDTLIEQLEQMEQDASSRNTNSRTPQTP